jgi:UDP-4-amino-4,6-dideoxy-N-acetyl-beta-L-altrosamine N-acetyltransferase
MQFIRYGVTLERLAPNRLELVRQWRNSDWVRPRMRHREFVSPEAQIKWFEGLSPADDWYFTALADGLPFGMFHVKNVDWGHGYGESGGFAGDHVLIGQSEPARAILALMDFAFLLLGLDALEAQYSLDLPKIVHFNTQLGYEPFSPFSDGFVRARVSAERYFGSSVNLRRAATTLYGTSAILSDAGRWPPAEAERRSAHLPPDFVLQLR